MKFQPVAAILLLCSALAFAAPASVDTQKSTLTVRVYKTGFFSAFAHDHEISAPIDSGSFSEDKSSVEIAITAANLKVLDKESSDSEKQKIQTRMLGPEVLDTAQYKEIRFKSTQVQLVGQGTWQVTGDLTLHGQTHPVAFRVQRVNGRYQGIAEIKQNNFGITPISIAGGGVKVKDAVRIEFDIVGQ